MDNEREVNSIIKFHLYNNSLIFFSYYLIKNTENNFVIEVFFDDSTENNIFFFSNLYTYIYNKFEIYSEYVLPLSVQQKY